MIFFYIIQVFEIIFLIEIIFNLQLAQSKDQNNLQKQYFQAGVEYYKQENLDLAKEQFQKCIDINVENQECLYNLSKVLDEMGYKEQALEYSRLLVGLNPSDNQAFYNMGTILYDLQQFDEAKRIFELALEKDTNDVDILQGLANCYFQLNDMKSALNFFQLCANQDPERVNCHIMNGIISFEQKNYEYADFIFRDLLKKQPDLDIAKDYISKYKKILKQKLPKNDGISNPNTDFKEKNKNQESKTKNQNYDEIVEL